MVDVAERSTRRGIQEMVLHVAGRLCLLAQLHPSEAERHDLHHLVSMLMKAFKDVGTDELVDPACLTAWQRSGGHPEKRLIKLRNGMNMF